MKKKFDTAEFATLIASWIGCILASGTGYSAITRIRAVYIWCAMAYGFKPFPVYIYQLVIIHSRFRNSFPNFQSDFAGYAPENGRARDLDVPHYQGQMVCRVFDTLYHLITCEMVGCQQAAFEYCWPIAEPYDFQLLHNIELFFKVAVEGVLPRAVECRG